MTRPVRLAILLLAGSLATGCGGGGKTTTQPSSTPTSATPTVTTSVAADSYADGIYHGPGFVLPLPRKPDLKAKTISISGKKVPARFYEVADVHYSLAVMTVAGQKAAGLKEAMTTFWSSNGPALNYRLSIDPPDTLNGAPSVSFIGKGAAGQVLGQAAVKDGTLFMVAIRADSAKPFNDFQDSVNNFELT